MIYYIVVYGVRYGFRYFLYRAVEDNLPKRLKWVAGAVAVCI